MLCIKAYTYTNITQTETFTIYIVIFGRETQGFFISKCGAVKWMYIITEKPPNDGEQNRNKCVDLSHEREIFLLIRREHVRYIRNIPILIQRHVFSRKNIHQKAQMIYLFYIFLEDHC